MDHHLYFSSVKEPLKSFLEQEKIHVTEEFFQALLRFLSKACSYEEEEIKIKPSLLLGFNLKKALESIPSQYSFSAVKGEVSGKDFEKSLKPLIPFCSYDWTVYVEVNQKGMTFCQTIKTPLGLLMQKHSAREKKHSLVLLNHFY